MISLYALRLQSCQTTVAFHTDKIEGHRQGHQKTNVSSYHNARNPHSYPLHFHKANKTVAGRPGWKYARLPILKISYPASFQNRKTQITHCRYDAMNSLAGPNSLCILQFAQNFFKHSCFVPCGMPAPHMAQILLRSQTVLPPSFIVLCLSKHV
jgi:hypothetical protein